ncbi:MAG: hypothetical protein U0992_18715 [Planctomycetaceae bacterium]
MLIREWTIAKPTPHVVRLEQRPDDNELALSVDGADVFWCPAAVRGNHHFVHEFTIDGVGYSLIGFQSPFDSSFEFSPTEVRSSVLHRLAQRRHILFALLFLTLSGLFLAGASEPRVARHFLSISRRADELLIAGQVFAAIVCSIAFAIQVRGWWRDHRAHRLGADHRQYVAPPYVRVGGPPQRCVVLPAAAGRYPPDGRALEAGRLPQLAALASAACRHSVRPYSLASSRHQPIGRPFIRSRICISGSSKPAPIASVALTMTGYA